jgi:hypothetical protein
MQKKLTLSIDAEIYEALHKVAGKRKIGRFIENLVRPHIMSLELPKASKHKIQDKYQENETLPWVEATLRDVVKSADG